MIRRRIAATLANTDQIPATLIEKRRLELPHPPFFSDSTFTRVFDALCAGMTSQTIRALV